MENFLTKTLALLGDDNNENDTDTHTCSVSDDLILRLSCDIRLQAVMNVLTNGAVETQIAAFMLHD